jgi:hypothetical protein
MKINIFLKKLKFSLKLKEFVFIISVNDMHRNNNNCNHIRFYVSSIVIFICQTCIGTI